MTPVVNLKEAHLSAVRGVSIEAREKAIEAKLQDKMKSKPYKKYYPLFLL